MIYATLYMTQKAYDELPWRDDMEATYNPEEGELFRVRGYNGVVKASVHMRSRRLLAWSAYPVTFVDNDGRLVNPPRSVPDTMFLPTVTAKVDTTSEPEFGETLAAVMDAGERASAAQAHIDAIHALTDGDLQSHRLAWRKCIERMQTLSAVNHQPDNADYYAHELAVFDRVFGVLCRLDEPAQPEPATRPWNEQYTVAHDGRLMRHVKTGGVYEVLATVYACPAQPPQSREAVTVVGGTLRDMDTLTLSVREGGNRHNPEFYAYAGTVTNTPHVWLANLSPTVRPGELPASGWRLQSEVAWTDTRRMVAYRSTKDGSLWLRPVREFYDGRFEPLVTKDNTPA